LAKITIRFKKLFFVVITKPKFEVKKNGKEEKSSKEEIKEKSKKEKIN